MFNKSIKEIVTEVIVENAREEALEILSKASPNRVNEFINYYNKRKFNVCCMHLDTIKMDLVHYGLMKQNPNDKFGDPKWME